MKKELFETAEMEVIAFDRRDVITTSDLDEYEGDKASIQPSLF